jgi:hypothetical protein
MKIIILTQILLASIFANTLEINVTDVSPYFKYIDNKIELKSCDNLTDIDKYRSREDTLVLPPDNHYEKKGEDVAKENIMESTIYDRTAKTGLIRTLDDQEYGVVQEKKYESCKKHVFYTIKPEQNGYLLCGDIDGIKICVWDKENTRKKITVNYF